MFSFNDFFKFLSLSACLLFPLNAIAQDLPPEPVGADSSSQESSPPDESAASEKPSLNLTPGSEPIKALPKAEKTVVPGPLQAQRQQLFEQIQAAEANGIGIKNYMMAFEYIEGMARKGESEEAIKKRMVPLVGALASQLKTKEYLKTKPRTQQAPAMAGNIDPSQILAPGQNIQDSLRKFGGMGGNQTNDLINKIVEQKGLKDKIPKGMSNDFIKQKLKDPKVQELLKRYSNR